MEVAAIPRHNSTWGNLRFHADQNPTVSEDARMNAGPTSMNLSTPVDVDDSNRGERAVSVNTATAIAPTMLATM